MKIAIQSDIHGNSWALEVVLRDLEGRGPDLIVNLGDSLYGPLDPMGTFDIIRSLPIVSIAGNEDRESMNHKRTITENKPMKRRILLILFLVSCNHP